MVKSGLDRLAVGEIDPIGNKRIGLIANPTAIDHDFRHAVDLLAERKSLVRLFGPEHGLRAEAQDMITVGGATDARTGLEIVSLYGASEDSLSPPPGSLEDLDAVVFDIQDVGARYYTYVWTMVLVMRRCAEAGVEMIVLDRPNPIGGVQVEGGDIEPGFDSFVGLRSLPNRHGMTAAEIAAWSRDEEALDLELTLVDARGWQRSDYHDRTGLPWVLPSPNMPTLDTAVVYPGMCLLEGTELSEGRGTTRPFEISGAPFIDGDRLADELESLDLPGVRFRGLSFLPTFQKHAGTLCGGVQIHVTDRQAFRSYDTGVAYLWAVKKLWPDELEWRVRAYEFVDDKPAIDLLAGSAALREGIDAGSGFAALCETWRAGEARFRDYRQKWLRYR